MFKTLIQNNKYSFNMNGDYKVNEIITRYKDSSTISIELDNIMFHNLDVKWLALLAHYEVNVNINDLFKIYFTECNSKVMKIKCGNLMNFREPIMVDKEFRVIPGFTNFAINKNGVVKSIKFNRVLKPSVSPYGYYYVNVYDSDKRINELSKKTSLWRSVTLHILLARAFINNKEPTFNIYVNHKDGNKLNINLSNLEWVTPKYNNDHAVESGLRSDNMCCDVKDIYTGEIHRYNTVSSAFKSIEAYKHPLMINVNNEIVPYLYNSRYEIKRVSDNRDWFYNKDNVSIFNNRFSHKFELLNCETSEVIEFDNIYDIARDLKIKPDRIIYSLQSVSKNIIYDGYSFRYKSYSDWDIKKCRVTSREFKLTNLENNEIVEFDSLIKTIRFLDIDKKTFKRHLKKFGIYKNWAIKEIIE